MTAEIAIFLERALRHHFVFLRSLRCRKSCCRFFELPLGYFLRRESWLYILESVSPYTCYEWPQPVFPGDLSRMLDELYSIQGWLNEIAGALLVGLHPPNNSRICLKYTAWTKLAKKICLSCYMWWAYFSTARFMGKADLWGTFSVFRPLVFLL